MSEACPPQDMAEKPQQEELNGTCQHNEENTLAEPALSSQQGRREGGRGGSTPTVPPTTQRRISDLKDGESLPGEGGEPVDPIPDEEQQQEDTALSPSPPNTEENETTGVDVAPAGKESAETDVSSAENKEEINHCETDHGGCGDRLKEKTEEPLETNEEESENGDKEATEVTCPKESNEGDDDPVDKPFPETKPERGTLKYLIAVGVVVLVAILVQHLLQHQPPPQREDVRPVDVFLKQMETVKTRFPRQRPELWNRNKIHLKRHLQTSRPTEPVSLILTAGRRAERTLHCLAQSLASAFSAAVNASVLHIDGTGSAGRDSDHVKLDIDRKLQGAFEGNQPVAVIHRFEELPPSSTLIFYRYCDHENAAYKNIFLIFTVLLEEEDEIPGTKSLSAVEEMVDDHLQKKFLSQSRPVSFDRMDIDKYGGLWSRISHLILPVAAEERMELHGC
uniref:Torsin-1A-interacting protein 1/2 AAA+ activator domain-containing protein n=1 Tax=Oryzias latipes TaxID=8090 RepID=A0A3P9L4F2_ORYLA